MNIKIGLYVGIIEEGTINNIMHSKILQLERILS